MRTVISALLAAVAIISATAQSGLHAQRRQSTFKPTPVMAPPDLTRATGDYVADEVAAVVGHSKILLSDIERAAVQVIAQRREAGSITTRSPRDEAFESLLIHRLFSNQARIDSLDKEMRDMSIEAETRVADMLDQVGSVRNLEKMYGKEIFNIKDEIRKELEDQELSQSMQEKVTAKVTVNYDEVVDFFNTIPKDSLPVMPEQYIYAQIVRMPPATEERKFEVRQRLLEYRERILKGEKLAVLARLYSADLGTAIKGGEWGPDNINQLVPAFIEALENLKPGKISEIVETEYGYHIIELLEPIKGDIVHYRHMLLKPEFTVAETQDEMRLLDSLAKVIGTDKVAFEKGVLEYSMDIDTRQNGGLVFDNTYARQTMQPRMAVSQFEKDIIDPRDYIAISKLKVGEVSAPFTNVDSKGNEVHKIVRLNKVIPTHVASLENDFEIIAEYALQNKKGETLNNWLAQAVPKMYVYISPEYRGIEFEHNWLHK